MTASNSYDAADQVEDWTYDAAGNLTNDGATSYSYNSLNRLTATSARGETRGYTYNGDGTLVARRPTAPPRTTPRTWRRTEPGASTTTGVTTTDYLYGNEVEQLGNLSAGSAPGTAWTGRAASARRWLTAAT